MEFEERILSQLDRIERKLNDLTLLRAFDSSDAAGSELWKLYKKQLELRLLISIADGRGDKERVSRLSTEKIAVDRRVREVQDVPTA
jgi:hypothetical protein